MLLSTWTDRSRNRLSLSWLVLGIASVFVTSGCLPSDENTGQLEAIWGRQGTSMGLFQKPRAMAIDQNDRLYLVDMTARIQVFDRKGHYLAGWQTPDHRRGKPTGLSVTRDGRLLVADTHYYRVLIYSQEGCLLKTIGGTSGFAPGEFGLVTDAVEDSHGNLYIAEYGDFDRIQKFTASGEFMLQWGGHGDQPGEFVRPQNLAIDQQDRIWVADACNHRIQVFDTDGKLLKIWGKQGGAAGELYYPYDIVLAQDESVYVAEFGNHRIQKFTTEGQSLGCWGTNGRQEGQLHNPWALVEDSLQRIHVLDTNNHRVQRVRMHSS